MQSWNGPVLTAADFSETSWVRSEIKNPFQCQFYVYHIFIVIVFIILIGRWWDVKLNWFKLHDVLLSCWPHVINPSMFEFHSLSSYLPFPLSFPLSLSLSLPFSLSVTPPLPLTLPFSLPLFFLLSLSHSLSSSSSLFLSSLSFSLLFFNSNERAIDDLYYSLVDRVKQDRKLSLKKSSIEKMTLSTVPKIILNA